MSNRTLTRSRLSLLVAAALFGASSLAVAQGQDPAEIPVDDLSVQANLDEDGLDYNDGNLDEEDDESAIADAQDPENDDLDVDGDFDPEVDPDMGAHGGATRTESGDVAMDRGSSPDVDGTSTVAVDAADAGSTLSVEPDDAEMDAMGFESDSEVAASGDLGTQTTMDGSADADTGVEAGPPADAFAATAGTEGFSDGSTAASAEQRFSELDGDSSGSLSSEEVASVQPLQSSFEEYDINGDGSLAQNEFQSFFAATADVEAEVQTAQVGDGTLDASDRAMDQDAMAASTEPDTDTVVASESNVVADPMDAQDTIDSTEATAAADADMQADATAATTEATDAAEATAATDGGMDYDSAYESGSLAEGEELEDEDLTVQSDEDL